MKKFLRKHIGLIIIMILVLVFPTCLSNQARLNMRIIVTGIAIDKTDDGYEVTAQYVKTTPGNESAGTGAKINFVADNDETMFGAISKLAYKAGKVSAFSHTNFIILGKNVLEENISELLDYFIRYQIIRSSSLLLVCDGNAADEIKKTENVELSVGLGLQKVFLFKEQESDGVMMSIIKFLNDCKSYSKTSAISSLKLKTNEENTKLKSKDEKEQGNVNQDTDSSQIGQSSQSGGNNDKYYFFESGSPVFCFYDGNYIGTLADKDAVAGFMIADNNAKNDMFTLKNINVGRLENAEVSINIKNKSTNLSVRYEDNIPCLDVVIKVDNCEIEQIKNKTIIGELTDEEFKEIKQQIEDDAGKKIGKCFITAKEFGGDIFHAYDLANRFHYKKTQKYCAGFETFLQNLKLNVQVDVIRMDY